MDLAIMRHWIAPRVGVGPPRSWDGYSFPASLNGRLTPAQPAWWRSSSGLRDVYRHQRHLGSRHLLVFFAAVPLEVASARGPTPSWQNVQRARSAAKPR